MSVLIRLMYFNTISGKIPMGWVLRICKIFPKLFLKPKHATTYNKIPIIEIAHFHKNQQGIKYSSKQSLIYKRRKEDLELDKCTLAKLASGWGRIQWDPHLPVTHCDCDVGRGEATSLAYFLTAILANLPHQPLFLLCTWELLWADRSHHLFNHF